MSQKIVAILNDLMFTVKIQEAAKRTGLEAVFVKSQEAALEQAKQNPVAVILDLNTTAVDPLALLSQLKQNEATKEVSVIGYVSHVQTELKQAAQEKGCDLVIARSAFSQTLPSILKRYAGS